jgi:thiamine pyrophosphate-dependent acetolactate synthase large subunit-like protein
MNESDLLIVFGASFSDHTGIERKKPIIQVDFDPMALGKFHPVELPVLGEIGVTAAQIAAALPEKVSAQDQRRDIARRWRIWREEKARRRSRDRGHGLNAALLFDGLSGLIPADAVIAVDVGNNTYSFGRYFECRSQRVLMSGYLGSIGFAFPAAMGAWAATRSVPAFAGRKVVSISGDGGFGQYLGEFNTAVKYGMNITHVLLNNSELGKISKEQRGGHWPVWETGLSNPNFAEYAVLCGGMGVRVSRPDELEGALTQGLAAPGPALVEIMTDVELV